MSKLIKAFMLSACDYTGYTWRDIKIISNDENGLIYSEGNKRQAYRLKDSARVLILENWVERSEIENALYEVKSDGIFKTISFTPFSADLKNIEKRISFLDKLINERKTLFKTFEMKEHLLSIKSKKETVHYDDEFEFQIVDLDNEIIKDKEDQSFKSYEEFEKILEKYNIEIINKEESTSVNPHLRGRPVLRNFIGPMLNGEFCIRYETSKTYEVMSN